MQNNQRKFLHLPIITDILEVKDRKLTNNKTGELRMEKELSYTEVSFSDELISDLEEEFENVIGEDFEDFSNTNSIYYH